MFPNCACITAELKKQTYSKICNQNFTNFQRTGAVVMETGTSGACSGKQSKGESSKRGGPLQSGKCSQYHDVDKRTPLGEEKERYSSKQSKFPSLSKLGRSHTFSFGRKKDKENEKKAGDKTSKVKERTMDKNSEESPHKGSTKKKAQERHDIRHCEDRSKTVHGKPAATEDRYSSRSTYASRHHELSRSRSYDSRASSGGKENRTKDFSTSSSKYVTGKESKNPKRKDCKRKEVPIDRGFDHNNIPLWLRNPPKILIQDFSSDYVDETTFDEEYFDLVQWAFRILEQQCNYRMYSTYVDFQLEDDEPTLLGAAQNEPLKVITTETARVGSTLEYILHPISTGAANVLQTGAKFADFTSRVFRGINFDSIIKKRSEQETPIKKQ